MKIPDYKAKYPLLSMLLLGVAIHGLVGCGSVSVRRTDYSSVPLKPVLPQKIYVENFFYAPDSLSGGRMGDRNFQWTVSDRLNRALVQRIRARITSAQSVGQGAPLPRQNAWLVKGHFVQVDEGSRLLRGLFGFGWGSTQMITIAEIYDLRDTGRRKPFLVLETEGGSNEVPGLLASGNPWEFRSGLTVDAQRTAREITRSLLEYLTVHNCIDVSGADTPKRPGRL